jgi:ubiquinone/menaquinone biosynthesis C-methylase UbiE
LKRDLDISKLEDATRLALGAGHRLLQTHRLHWNDLDHVRDLLNVMQPPHGARVLDAGCGIGEVSRLMSVMRPDLSFILANVSPLQISLCPSEPQFERLLADCHDLPLPDEHVDAVMFASALTQMDAPTALREAARVTKTRGIVFLFEMVRDGGDAEEFERVTTARVHKVNDLIAFARDVGLVLDRLFYPATDDAHFRGMLRDLGCERLIDPIKPVIIRFRKA